MVQVFIKSRNCYGELIDQTSTNYLLRVNSPPEWFPKILCELDPNCDRTSDPNLDPNSVDPNCDRTSDPNSLDNPDPNSLPQPGNYERKKIKGNYYLYWRWWEGKVRRSKYLGPVKEKTAINDGG